MPNGLDGELWVQFDSSCVTKHIVGRDSGVLRVHVKAMVTTKIIAFAN